MLGDPGSGKTTTIKRLILSLFEETAVTTSETVRFPVFVVCREVDWSATTLAQLVLANVGLDVAKIAGELGSSAETMRSVASAVIDELDCLVAIDGIDEIADPDARRDVLNEISRLARLMQRGRVVCSARSGDAPHLDEFRVAELQPLTSDQVLAIASRRLPAGHTFVEAIAASELADLVDRPLFLNQLLTVFETTGALPERPAALYDQMLRLMLNEWDEQRRVTRRSAYGRFDSMDKREFLAEMAFHLILRDQVVFSEADLVEVYEEIAPSYELPANHARKVVREIESHVGIVVDVPGGFQFSHLTLQEYLTASSIARRPFDDQVLAYLRRFPAIVAIAVALSSRPDAALAECVRKSRPFESPGAADTFASRLGIERPRFRVTEQLGESLLLLFGRGSDNPTSWKRLASIEAVRQSVASALPRYRIDQRRGKTRLHRLSDDGEPRRSGDHVEIHQSLFDLLDIG